MATLNTYLVSASPSYLSINESVKGKWPILAFKEMPGPSSESNNRLSHPLSRPPCLQKKGGAVGPRQGSVYWLQLQGRDHSKNPQCPTAGAVNPAQGRNFSRDDHLAVVLTDFPLPGHSDFPDLISQSLEGIGKGGGSRAILRDTFNSYKQQV